ncbi:M13 family metallopeptidase [Methanospirillum lacunae]|uniref:M13 family peptidase n=1 Tax=Methanospirillum lacunae TaxID=668570 RepID=A0A2V2MX67_9EURY|nr:M13 family metallopeptidase [Methanospirillum lacunae]PWR71989.1 M13 family peptidase [Methanospirillum lacunae]
MVKVLLFLAILLPLLIQAGYANTTIVSGPFTLDTGVNPGDDLFGYVNNPWIENHPVPENKSSYTAFTEVEEKTLEQLRILFEHEADDYATGQESLIGKFYSNGMDTGSIDRQDLSPLKRELTSIDEVSSHSDLMNVSVLLVQEGIFPFFLYYSDQDPMNSSYIISQVEQGGLGLPDRDYYFRNNTGSRKIREEYRRHIKNTFLLMNENETEADCDARAVYRIEEEIASSHYTEIENRDPWNTTHILSWNDLNSQYPNISWDTLSSINGSGKSDRVNVHQISAVSKLDQMLMEVPLNDWKKFLKFKFVDSLSESLSKAFEEEHFNFYGRILDGVNTPEPRWKRVLATVDAGISEEVGRRYVENYFNSSVREKAKNISHTIRLELRERIQNLTWMENSTRNAAVEKLDAMDEKIGYPDNWMDYSDLNLSDSYARNILETNHHKLIHGPMGLEKIGGTVDRTAWLMSPQTTNAYYSPGRNEIVFPAAMLQPPFFDPAENDSINYGGIGAVMGHEMTHGFDDQGGQYDKDGNLRNWWDSTDTAKFVVQERLIIDQVNRFEAAPGVFINGNLTVGEDVADFGGLTLAYHAWDKNGRDVIDEPNSNNITPVREFFMSFARSMQGNATDQFLRASALTGQHPWNKFRVNGAPFNVPEFYNAFPEVGPGNPLYRAPEERPVIW